MKNKRLIAVLAAAGVLVVGVVAYFGLKGGHGSGLLVQLQTSRTRRFPTLIQKQLRFPSHQRMMQDFVRSLWKQAHLLMRKGLRQDLMNLHGTRTLRLFHT